ncbi:MAG: peptidoglycan-associated lipoprotein Pal [Candidatus Methylomirabilales bacterium]
MRRWWVHLGTTVIVVPALLILVGCAKKRTGTGEAESGSTGRVEEETIAKRPDIREAPVTPTQAEKASPLKDVYFEFDEAVLGQDAKQALRANIRWLRANPRVRVQVEGHADERGTNEYNLGLGNLRAKTVRDYLVAGGIAAKRITIISYGEERPFVLGHDEEAWKWNRRGHFVVRSG